MKPRISVIVTLLLCLPGLATGGAPPPVATAQQTTYASLRTVIFIAEQKGQAGAHYSETENQIVTLSGPDNKKAPTVWQGPMTIYDKKRATSCKADVSLITQVYSINHGESYIVVSYSGSQSYLRSIDSTTCEEKSKQAFFTEGIFLHESLITILPGCEDTDNKNVSYCSAGKVIVVDDHNQVKTLAAESKVLNKEVVGVEFIGNRKILNAKTPSALLIPE